MEIAPLLHNLRKILPEVEITNQETQHILRSNLVSEKKVQTILSNYFKNKASKWGTQAHRNTLKSEAKYINRLYPSLTLEYIYNQLDTFKDMPNRREIVLRIIVREKKLEVGDMSVSPMTTKRTIPQTQMVNNAKTRRIDLGMPATVTSQQEIVPMPPSHFASAPLSLQLPKPPLTNGVVPLKPAQHIFQEQNAISSTTNTEMNFVPVIKPTITSTITMGKPATITSAATSTITKRATITTAATSTITKPATITSAATSTITSTDMNLTPADDTNIPNSSREPFNVGTIIENSDYEIPDIMEHFDLPVFDMRLPIARNRAITSIAQPVETSDDQLTVGRNCTVNSNVTIDFNPNLGVNTVTTSPAVEVSLVSEQESTSSSVEEINADTMNDAVLNTGEVNINQPTEQKRDSQDSNQTEIYSPPQDIVEDNEIPAARHYTVNLLSPTFIRIKQSLVPEQYQNRNDGRQQQSLDLRNVTLRQKDTFVAEVPGRNLQLSNEPVNNVPSTSKQPQVVMYTDIDDTEFNLIEYVREITNASDRTIKRHCRRLHISTKEKPSPDSLNLLVDSIFTITIDSEDSEQDLSELENDSESPNEEPIFLKKPLNTDNPKQSSERNSNDENLDPHLVNSLCSMFPDACPKYIRGLCKGKVMNDEVLYDLTTIICDTKQQYPKRPKPEPEPEELPENQLEILQEFLPDADPDYLRMMCDKFEGKPDMVKKFINEAMEKREYPTKKEYLRRQQLSAQQKQYTIEFNVENFIKLIPDPHAFFSDPSRKLKLNTLDSHYALVFLRNHFNRLPIRTIQSVFTKSGGSIAKCMKDLRYIMTQSNYVMKSVRKTIDYPNTENIPLLQELAFYSHEKEINEYLKEMKEKEEAERQEAKDKGLMKTCSCCYDEEVLPRDIFCCENGCEFCKSCIVKSSEVRFGEGKLDFPCLMDCQSSFTLQTLQAVLSPKLFSKVAQKKALEEIKSAGIDELEQCPFCDFATIPAEGYNIFTCMNPECMKESCRMCKEPSHIPLRCDEIEKDEDVRARTFVENKMTEALLRKCWKCGVKFFKEEGCNKMTCSCGAQMCYVCGQPVSSYKHFNGNGGDRYDLCPLYSDTNVLNKENVLRGAEQAKAEIGSVNLKHDPTADVDQHYKERRKMYPQDHLLAGQMMAPPPRMMRPQIFFNAPRNLGPWNPQRYL